MERYNSKIKFRWYFRYPKNPIWKEREKVKDWDSTKTIKSKFEGNFVLFSYYIIISIITCNIVSNNVVEKTKIVLFNYFIVYS